jgi:hypothetical protein
VTALNLPRTPVERARAGSAVQSEIVAHLEDGYGFFDIRTLGAGHWVVEVVTTAERDAHALAGALNARWEVEADFRPGPLQNVIAWEGYLNVHPMDVPVRVVAVLDHPAPGEPSETAEVRMGEEAWLRQELAQRPETHPAQALAAIGCVHPLVLAGVAS